MKEASHLDLSHPPGGLTTPEDCTLRSAFVQVGRMCSGFCSSYRAWPTRDAFFEFVTLWRHHRRTSGVRSSILAPLM